MRIPMLTLNLIPILMLHLMLLMMLILWLILRTTRRIVLILMPIRMLNLIMTETNLSTQPDASTQSQISTQPNAGSEPQTSTQPHSNTLVLNLKQLFNLILILQQEDHTPPEAPNGVLLAGKLR